MPAITRAEPDFSFKMQPPAAKKRENALAPKGKLSIKLIGARHLSAPSTHSRPYVVVTYDQNEFISREPIHEEGEEATGVAIPKDNSPKGQALSPPDGSAMQISPSKPSSGLGRALNENGNGVATPPRSEPTPSNAPPITPPAEALSAYNPTWKHEVIL